MTALRPAQLCVAVGLMLALSPAIAHAADAQLSGMVALDGRPLAKGRILFHGKNGQFVGSRIKDGKFAIDSMPSGARIATIEGEGVPKKYADEETSALKVAINGGENQFNFELRAE
jgi:hypothetical protein